MGNELFGVAGGRGVVHAGLVEYEAGAGVVKLMGSRGSSWKNRRCIRMAMYQLGPDSVCGGTKSAGRMVVGSWLLLVPVVLLPKMVHVIS